MFINFVFTIPFYKLVSKNFNNSAFYIIKKSKKKKIM